MLELDKLISPMNVNQVPSIFGYLNRIADVMDICTKYVRSPGSDASNDETIRQTLRSPVMRSLTVKF